MKMNYDKFVEALKTELQSNMAPDAVIRRNEIQKVNRKVDSLSIGSGDSLIMPTINLEDEYERYMLGFTVAEVAFRIIERIEEALDNAPEIPELSAESARKNLYTVVVNAKANEELLKTVPHERMEDLAIIPRFKVGQDGSFLVKNEMCSRFRLTPDEVMEIARSNTENQTFTCESMMDMMWKMMRDSGLGQEYIEEVISDAREQECMYVLSNQAKVDGAIAIASEKALEQAYEVIGEEFYVLPSSRHEVILVPRSIAPEKEDLRSMVREVNASSVAPEDRLSDEVYRYDAVTKKVTIADSKERKIENEEHGKNKSQLNNGRSELGSRPVCRH